MFYDKLLELSLEHGYNSPTAAAREIGMTGAHISKWKNGSEPTDTTKLKFAQLFGVSPSVFDETEKAAPPEDEAAEYLEDLRRGEVRALLDFTRGMSKNEIEAMTDFAKRMKGVD